MSNQVKSPHRSSVEDEEQPFTPCTRLSRLTVESLSNRDNRHKKSHLYQTPTNLMDRLSEASGKKLASATPHRNLVMFFGSDRISMNSKSKDSVISEDEDSDGDLFSSALYPLSSPDRPFTKKSIFDDEFIGSGPLEVSISRKQFSFDEDEEEKEEEEEDHYDPSSSWLSQLFYSTESDQSIKVEGVEEKEEDESENRQPRLWKGRIDQTTQALPLEGKHSSQARSPLQEILWEGELPANKKLLLASGKVQKMRYMRALSPTRLTQRRCKEPPKSID
ncbi:hypothetical protein INT47_004422 [Mucor saturninus]|uniref:Uncharacterized protein n=1 Tax=Mucor saturninus TaxID=64648 RepID=A0A8H7R0Y7_9FUNG|nr:hypothetical protein INT47_004422 [Mucor saturninus]